MNLKTQARMLRVLQEMKCQRIGGGRTLSVNVRLIAASNKNLKKESEKGNFREELYYRLNVIPIEVPPLRARIKDIPFLIDIFLEEYSKEDRKSKKRIGQEALDLLLHYPWPGNVRELKNLMERLAIMVQNDVIEFSDIPRPYNPGVGEKGGSAEGDIFRIDGVEKAK